ncbi:MAG: hypothetical protein A2Y40_00090 [Candidatus Margulisbacteria bacterium GWF2_35_9]|nr:MAG: hypothetical protein A2Y40_00090 [Candidatus Margulisbacteria bacterium GWF2_35_9]
MDKYYYFAAQLPGLMFQQKENIPSMIFFKEEAAKWLTKEDLNILMSVDINNIMQKTGFKILAECTQFEYDLRSELAKYRQSVHEDFEYKINLFPMSFIKEGNPLEVELRLLKYRWDFYEEKQFGHYSDMTYLVLYHMKLQVLWRIESFNKEIGRGKFLNTCMVELAAA